MSGIELGPGSSLDWLEFTVPVKGRLPSEAAVEWAGHFGGMVPLEHGRYGYSSGAAVLGCGCLWWSDDRPDMGVHVSLPSDALERYTGDWHALCQCVWWDLGKFTRCDLALDQGETPIDTVVEAVRARQVVSHFRKANQTVNLWGDGCTIYLGASTSDTRVRIYDKRAELLARGQECGCEVLVRCEAQFRRERADAAMRELYGGAHGGALMRGVLDFRDVEAADQSNRADVLPWWERWLSGAAAVKLKVVKVVRDLAKMRRWVERQVSQTLGVLLKADGDNPYWLLDRALLGWSRAPEWKRALALAPVQ